MLDTSQTLICPPTSHANGSGNAFSVLKLLRTMAMSREGDRREGILFRQGRSWLQVPGAGHEALCALVYCLGSEDYIYPYYRERAVALARGVSNYQLALAFFGKDGSCSAGRQMSSHYSDYERRIFPSATPTGLQCLPAAGTAWACQRDGSNAVSLCFIGDAAVRQGEFYEALCFAVQESLPLILVVEDNGYGISTPTASMAPWNLGVFAPERRICVNGRDALAVHEAGTRAVAAARSGAGPQVLWMELDRLWSHTASDDHRVYRSADELEAMLTRDPITLLRDHLIGAGEITGDQWDAELAAMATEVDEDYARAEHEANPDPLRVKEQLFSPLEPATYQSLLPPQEAWTMAAALNSTLHREMAADDSIVMFGQDIEDPKGGVFGITKGLTDRFPGRVVNSPLAEATIAGVAAGLAVAGYKPVFEIQFIDFVGTALNQIMNQIATLRWRSAGAWKCPMVLMAPCGAYLPSGGPWHSQMNEAIFAHTPGLQIVVPASAQDAAALLRAAINGDDPVLMLLPKHLFRQHCPAVEDSGLRIGQAVTRVAGTQVTVVAYGNCVEVATGAAAQMLHEEISVEVIDLRSLVPCDWPAIEASLAKTGRLVVVHEDVRTCGFGQAIITEMTSLPQRWNLFAAPPQLVARDDVHMPYHADLEIALLPSVADVCDAIRLTMRY